MFPEFPEIDAVGVPEFTLITANLALAVDWPPIRRSTVELFGAKNPDPSVQLELPPEPPGQVDQDGVVPPIRHCDPVPTFSLDKAVVEDA